MLLYVIPLLHSTLGSVKIPPSRHRLLIWEFVPFKAWARMLPNVTKWLAVLHWMLIPNRSLNPCHVKSIFRCHCIDAFFQAVVHTLVPPATFRLLSSIDSNCLSRGGRRRGREQEKVDGSSLGEDNCLSRGGRRRGREQEKVDGTSLGAAGAFHLTTQQTKAPPSAKKALQGKTRYFGALSGTARVPSENRQLECWNRGSRYFTVNYANLRQFPPPLDGNLR